MNSFQDSPGADVQNKCWGQLQLLPW